MKKQAKRAAGTRKVSVKARKAGAKAGRQAPILKRETRGRQRLTKQALLIERLSRPEGTRIDELTKELGWLPHTVRAAFTGLRRKGYVIARQKADGEAVYRATPPGAVKPSRSNTRRGRAAPERAA